MCYGLCMFLMCYATRSLLCNALRLAFALLLSVRLCSGSIRVPRYPGLNLQALQRENPEGDLEDVNWVSRYIDSDCAHDCVNFTSRLA